MENRERSGGFFRGLTVGVALGVGLGAAVAAGAAAGWKTWDKQGPKFQLGYVVGFFDAGAIARHLDRDGFLDKHFPTWAKVNPYMWMMEINKVYEDEAARENSVVQAMSHAGTVLRKVHGNPKTTYEKNLARFRKLMAEKSKLEKARKEAEKTAGEGAAPAETGEAAMSDVPTERAPEEPAAP